MKRYKCSNSILNTIWRDASGFEHTGRNIKPNHLSNLYHFLIRFRKDHNRIREKHPDYWIKWCREVAKIRGIKL